jgi:hypothetical protein
MPGQAYPGTNLRGTVVRAAGRQPLASARVDLYYFDKRYPAGQQWRLISSTYTDAGGLYYFKYVRPDNYSIQVNLKKNSSIQVINIDYGHYAYQDLPMIVY